MADIQPVLRDRPIVTPDGRLTEYGQLLLEQLRACLVDVEETVTDHETRITALEP